MQRSEQRGKFPDDLSVLDNRGRRRLGPKSAQLAAGLDIGKHQRGKVVAVGACKHDVAHIGREMVDEASPQRPNAGPGAGRQLEVLGNTAVEQQAFAGIMWIGEFQRVSQFVETVFVESVAREVLPACLRSAPA